MADFSSLLGSTGVGGAIGKAIVGLELDSKKYLAELKAAEGQTVAGSNSMSKSFLGFTSVAKAGVAAVGLGILAFAAKSVQGFQEVASETRTLEKQLGITAEQASILRAQGEALGVGTDKLSTGFGILAKHLVANDATIQKYGIDVARTADGQIDFQAVLAQVSGKFEAMGPSVNRTALAMNLFGRSGKSLLPLLAADSQELKKLEANARAAGLVLGEDDVDAARAFSIAQRELGEASKGLEVQMARGLIPALTDIIDSISKVVSEAGPLVTLFGTVLAEAVGGLADNIATIVGGLDKLAGMADKVGESADGAGPSVSGLFQSLLTLGNLVQDVVHPVGQFQKAWDQAMGTEDQAKDKTDELADATDQATGRLQRFGNMGKKVFADFEKNVGESMQVSIGQFDKLKDAFDTTPKELKHQLDLALQIARRYARDLEAIMTDPKLSDRQKAALANLPANQRDAFVKAGDQSKQEIAKQAVRLQGANRDAMHAVTNAGKDVAGKGGTQIGDALMGGVKTGIVGHSQEVQNAVAQAVRDAIAAGKKAAGAASPSKEMAKLGRDLMDGLRNGLQDEDQKLYAEITKIMDTAVAKAKESLSKVRGAAGDFRGGIAGAFSGFADLSGAFAAQQGEGGGMPLLQILEVQKLQAQDMADVLEALKRQGASKGLLGQIAGGGPEAVFGLGRSLLQAGPDAIKTANDTLASINKIAGDTSKGLTADFFGGKISELKGKLDHLGDVFDRVGRQIENHSHDIIIDGDRLAVAVRSSSLQGAKRNGGKTGF